MKRIWICALAAMLLLAPACGEGALDSIYADLEGLGIEVPMEARSDIEADIEEMLGYMPPESGYTADDFMDYTFVLTWLGMGKLDEEEWYFEPYTDAVYAFDSELFDIQAGYEDLLAAVQRMSGGEIEISDCRMMLTGRLFEAGEGVLPIYFKMNGVQRSYPAEFYYDWMDLGIIEYINSCLEEQGASGSLWCMYDGGQGLVLFYNTGEWAQRFREATGIALYRSAAEITLEDYL